jgi:hypothetical protein
MDRLAKIKLLQNIRQGKSIMKINEVLIIQTGDKPGTFKYYGKTISLKERERLEKVYKKVICINYKIIKNHEPIGKN